MKNQILKYSILSISLVISFTMFSQTLVGPNHQPFIGTWEHVNGNEIFRVFIWADDGNLKGNYEMVEVVNGNEIIIYESNFIFPNANVRNPHAIFGGSLDGVKMGARIEDWFVDDGNPETGSYNWGSMTLTIQQSSCGTCPVTARWIVEDKPSGIRLTSQPLIFNLPLDLILTKVN